MISESKRIVVGHHYAHHSESSGYDRLARYLDAEYLDLTSLVVGRKYHGIPLGPFRRSVTNCVLHASAMRARLVHLLYPEFHLSSAMRHYRGSIVATVHHPFEWHFGTLGEVAGSRRRSRLLRQIRQGFRHVDAVIVLTPTEVAAYEAELPHATVRFIPHGVEDYRRFATDGTQTTGELKICVVGQTYRDVGLLDAVVARAAKQGKQWKFHLVGFRRANGTKIAENPLVQIEPRLTEQEYLSLLGSCDVHFLPLTHATANNALLEAHSVGTPTMISSLPTVDPYCLPSTRRFFDADEAWSLLERAAEDKAWWLQLRKLTRTDSPRFHWQRIASDVQRLYSDLS